MPASKTKHYSEKEKDLAQLGRAFAHPARIRILNLLDENMGLRNKDLSKALRLDKGTIHCHLKKLNDASLITTVYAQKCFWITKNMNAEDKLKRFFNR